MNNQISAKRFWIIYGSAIIGYLIIQKLFFIAIIPKISTGMEAWLGQLRDIVILFDISLNLIFALILASGLYKRLSSMKHSRNWIKIILGLYAILLLIFPIYYFSIPDEYPYMHFLMTDISLGFPLFAIGVSKLNHPDITPTEPKPKLPVAIIAWIMILGSILVMITAALLCLYMIALGGMSTTGASAPMPSWSELLPIFALMVGIPWLIAIFIIMLFTHILRAKT